VSLIDQPVVVKSITASFLNYAERLAFFATCQEMVEWQYLEQLEHGELAMTFRGEVIRRLTERKSGFFAFTEDAERFIDFVHKNGLQFSGGFLTTVAQNVPFDAVTNVNLLCATKQPLPRRPCKEGNKFDFTALFSEMKYPPDEKLADTAEKRKRNPFGHRDFDPYANRHRSQDNDDYSMFPIEARHFAFPGGRQLEVVLVYDYESLIDYVQNTADFAFTTMLWNGNELFPRCRQWDAVWTKSCRLRVRDIEWHHAYNYHEDYRSPDFDPYHCSNHKEENMLMRVTARRIRWESRHFTVQIMDEVEILDGVDDQETVAHWPSEHAYSLMERDKCQRSHGPHLYVSQSPETGSLCVASLPWHFPWWVRPPMWRAVQPRVTEAPREVNRKGGEVPLSKAGRRRERARATRCPPLTSEATGSLFATSFLSRPLDSLSNGERV